MSDTINKNLVKIKRMMDAAFEAHIEEPLKRKYLDELHPSTFPYCGLRAAYEKMQNGGDILVTQRNLGMSYYVTMGTHLHTLFQEWLGKTIERSSKKKRLYVRVIGNWRCTQCKTLHTFTHYKKCSCGSWETNYEELGISSHKGIVKGHTDGLFLIDGKYYIVDYKTSSGRNIWKHQNQGINVFPYLKNVAQIKSYCYLVGKKYGVKVSGWYLIYVSRDTPNQMAICGESFNRKDRLAQRHRIDRSVRHFKIVKNLKTWKQVKTLIDEKPCRDLKYYERLMHDKYNPCPLSAKGLCWKRDGLVNKMKVVHSTFSKA